MSNDTPVAQGAISVHSNWKADEAGKPWTAHVLPHTILQGPNGIGKSRVVEALQLALAGEIDDIAGRVGVKTAKTLWRGWPAGDSEGFIDVRWACYEDVETPANDGTTGMQNRLVEHHLHVVQEARTRKPKWELDGGKITKPPGMVLLVADLKDRLFRSADTAERFLSQALGFDLDKVVAVAKKKLARSPARDDASELLDALAQRPGMTPAAMIEELAMRRRAADAFAKEYDAAAAAVVEALGGDVTDDDLARAQAALDAAQQDMESARAVVDRTRRLPIVASQLIEKRARRKNVADNASGRLADQNLPVVQNGLAALHAAQQARPDNPYCPVCSTEVGAEALAGFADTLATWLRSHQAAVAAEQLDIEIAALQEEGRDLYQGLPVDVAQTVAAGTFDPDAWLQGATTRYQEAIAALDELQRRRVAMHAPQTTRELADAAAARAAILKEAEGKAVKALADVAKKACADLAKRAQAYIPAHMGTIGISLRPDVEIGFVEGEGKATKINLPSGGQQGALLVALAAALLENQDGIALLIPEDRWYDRATVGDMLIRLREVERAGVWILFPVVDAPGGQTEGWHVVDWSGDNGQGDQAREEATVETATIEGQAEPPAAVDPSAAVDPPEDGDNGVGDAGAAKPDVQSLLAQAEEL